MKIAKDVLKKKDLVFSIPITDKPSCNVMKSCDQSRDRSNQIGTISDHY